MYVTTRSRSPAADPPCAAAVDLARAAAVDTAGNPAFVGEYVAAEAEDNRVVTHFFACRAPAYPGWRWAVTVVRAPRARAVTVNEAVLLPGPSAILPPSWVPWSSRLRPGDLGVGDILPALADDERLEPGYAATGDEDADRLAVWELGLGRARVLSAAGRAGVAERWYAGDSGPGASIAMSAPGRCGECGFFLRLAGMLGRVFGVCANEYAPDDGRVVALDHGCGAHSEAAAVAEPDPEPATPIVDTFGYDTISRPTGE